MIQAKILDPNPSQGLILVKIFDLHHVRGLTPAKILDPNPRQDITLVKIFDPDHVWGLMHAKILDSNTSQGLTLVKIFDLVHVRGLTPAKILDPIAVKAYAETCMFFLKTLRTLKSNIKKNRPKKPCLNFIF